MKKTLALMTASLLVASTAAQAASDCGTRQMQGNWTAMVLGNFPDDTRDFLVPEAAMIVCDIDVSRTGNLTGSCLQTTNEFQMTDTNTVAALTGMVWAGRRTCEVAITLDFNGGAFQVEVEGRPMARWTGCRTRFRASPMSICGRPRWASSGRCRSR